MRYKMIIRCLTMVFAAALLLSACSSQKQRQVAPENSPALHIDHYDQITALYGTERMEALNKLGFQLEDCNVIHGELIGVPLEFSYCGIEMEIYLRFNSEAKLHGVSLEKTYAYPEDTEQAVKDTLSIAAQLLQDLGEPHEVDTWNDWLEERYDVEMDSETPAYKEAEQIRKMLTEESASLIGGSIMWWDMTSVASNAVKELLKSYGDGRPHGFSFNVDRLNNEICLSISY